MAVVRWRKQEVVRLRSCFRNTLEVYLFINVFFFFSSSVIVIDSCLGVGVCCVVSSEGELEGASWVLCLDGTPDGEGGTLHHLLPLLLALRNPLHGGDEGDGWL